MRLVLTAVGAYIGGQFGYPQLGAALGSLAGAALTPKEKIEGNKLDDLSAPKLQYGAPWPRVYGRHRVAGVPLWASDLRAVESTQDVGKGGGTEVTSTTYKLDLLLGLAIDTDAVGFSRIWFNKKLVYNVGPGASPDSIAGSTSPNSRWSEISFFTGDPAQLPWDVYEAAVGIGNAPAYRHRVTIGFQDLDTGSSGIPPLIEVEFYTAGTALSGVYVDNFSDGIAPYTEVGFGDSVHFSGDSLEYGPLIQGLAFGPGGGAPTIERSITSTTTKFASVRMRYSSVGLDDSTVLDLRDGAVPKISFIAMREENFDPLRRPYVVIDAEHVALWTTSIELFAWYRCDVTFVPGAGNSYAEFYLGDALIQTTPMVGDYTSFDIDAIEFRVEAADGGGSGQFAQLRLIGEPATIDTVDLADIVDAECSRVMDISKVNSSDLVGIEVTGFGTTTAPRQTLEELAALFYFEAFCDSQINFVLRGGSSLDTLTYIETGAGVDEASEPFNGMDRSDELEVPAFYSVTVPDITRDYEPVSVMSDRLIGQSREVRQLKGSVVMTPSQVKGRADSFAMDARVSSHSGMVNLGIEHISRTPTDVVTLTDIDGTTYRTRIIRTTFADTVLNCELVLDDANSLQSAGVGPADGEPATEVTSPGATLLELVDGPILRDDDDDAGLYGATRITGGSGVGSRVLKSVDGTTFSTVGDIFTQSIGGFASTALAGVENPYVWDEVSSVTVSVSGALSSSTRAAMQTDSTINLAAIKSGDGWEYLRFRVATLVSPLVYTLTGFLRGIRGTGAFIDGHAVGDRFLLLRTAGMIRIPGSTPEIGFERSYKGVTIGQDLASAASIAFTNQAVGLKPFSPTRLRAERDTSGNITFTWGRRTRLAVRYGGSGGTLAPLGEDTEAYQLDVYDGVDVVRTISATSESATYSAANQTTDFGAPVVAGDLDTEVFQISQTVGRGYGHRKSV